MKTKQQPLLTAIILTYNNESTIERCIKSIVEQKTSHPYEVHIYDDCSRDNNLKICKDYSEQYPEKIKLFPQQKNTFLKPYKKTQTGRGKTQKRHTKNTNQGWTSPLKGPKRP